VSLLDWRTGFGNARYWVLKLLLEHFQVLHPLPARARPRIMARSGAGGRSVDED
jgi:hypothetical protein